MSATQGPLKSFDDWEDFVLERYPEQGPNPEHKAKDEYRNYDDPKRATVREFYRLNHQHQTLEFAREKKAGFGARNRREMSVWEGVEFLNTLVDDSDPDTDLTQIEHLLQTSEAIRADGHPRWFVLTGLIHDLGKTLCLHGEEQWAVVGDTFPVGCKFSDKVVFPEFFALNADSQNPELMTEHGIYEPGCGLDNVTMSWGHDEYMYTIAKDHMPEEALYMIRYHSFYAAHKEGAYTHLMDAKDKAMFKWVKAFNPYDLYSKSPERPNVEKLKPYYDDLIAEFFPATLMW